MSASALRVAALMSCPLVLLLLTGCASETIGVQAGSLPPVDGTTEPGTITTGFRVQVHWPSAAVRMIPDEALAVRVTVSDTDTSEAVGEALLRRGEHETTIPVRPGVECEINARAYPASDASSAPLASASSRKRVGHVGFTPVALVMASTIERIEVTPSPVTVTNGSTVTLSAKARDAQGREVKVPPFWWVISPGDRGMDFVHFVRDPVGGTVELRAHGVGTATVTAYVDQVEGQPEYRVESSATVIVQAPSSDGQAPVVQRFEPERDEIGPGDTVGVVCVASDPQNDTLSYSWEAYGGSLTTSGATAAWEAPSELGEYAIRVAVSDGKGHITCVGTTVKVSRTSQPPTIKDLRSEYGELPPGGISSVTCVAQDPDGGALAYAWSMTGGTILGGGAIATWRAPATAGRYTITCDVTDSSGRSSFRAITITVTSTVVDIEGVG